MNTNRIRSITWSLCAFAALPASAAIINVPGDAASLPEAVEIAEDGDTIWCRGDLIEGVQFTDLGRKRLTLYAGVFDQTLEEFRTGNAGAIWNLPDGTVLYGDGFELRGLFRVRDGAEAAAFSMGRFVSEAEAFVVGEDARFELLLFQGDDVEFNGPIRLDAGSTFTATESFEPVRFELNSTLEMEPGSRLVAGEVHIPQQGQIIATDAELDVFSIRGDGGESLLWMSGGELRARDLEDWPGTVRLDSVDVFAEGAFQDTDIHGDIRMQDTSFVSTRPISAFGLQSDDQPLLALEGMTVTAPHLELDGPVVFSGDVYATASVGFDSNILITGDTTFYGHTQNQGLFTILDGDLSFLGGLDNDGSIVFDADNIQSTEVANRALNKGFGNLVLNWLIKSRFNFKDGSREK